MSREWTNIDVLRMEKFLLVTRRYLGASFEVLKKGGWKEGEVEEMMGLLGEVPLNVGEMRIPNGLRYHVIDIYVDEVERVGVLSEGEDKVEEQLLEKLLKPLREIAEGSPTKTVRSKAKEALADERLPGNEKMEVEKDEEDEGWQGFD